MKAGWKTVKLGEIAEIYNGNTVSDENKKRLIALPNAGLAFIATKDVGFDGVINYDNGINIPGVEAADFKVARKDAVLVCAEGGSAGRKIGHIDRDVHFGNKLFALNASSTVLPRYLYHYCLSEDFRKKFKGLMAGLIGGVSVAKFKQIEIPLPPLTEQKRIVALLDEAFAGIEEVKAKAEANAADSAKMFESLLDALIQGKLSSTKSTGKTAAEYIQEIGEARKLAVTQGKAKLAKSEPNNNSSPFELPRDWKWAQLESLTICISDGVHKKPNYVPEGIPFVTVKNMTAGPGISFDDLNYITREDHEEYIKRTHPEAGDILITKDGTIGVVRMIETDVEFSIFVSVALIKPVTKRLAPYLTYALSAPCVQKQIIPQGAALKHLYLVDLRRLAIPIPPPSEQDKIVAELDLLSEQTHHLRKVYEKKATLIDDLRKSILYQAFSGELTA